MTQHHHARASWRNRVAVGVAGVAVVLSLGVAATASAQVASSALSTPAAETTEPGR